MKERRQAQTEIQQIALCCQEQHEQQQQQNHTGKWHSREGKHKENSEGSGENSALMLFLNKAVLFSFTSQFFYLIPLSICYFK